MKIEMKFYISLVLPCCLLIILPIRAEGEESTTLADSEVSGVTQEAETEIIATERVAEDTLKTNDEVGSEQKTELENKLKISNDGDQESRTDTDKENTSKTQNELETEIKTSHEAEPEIKFAPEKESESKQKTQNDVNTESQIDSENTLKQGGDQEQRKDMEITPTVPEVDKTELENVPTPEQEEDQANKKELDSKLKPDSKNEDIKVKIVEPEDENTRKTQESETNDRKAHFNDDKQYMKTLSAMGTNEDKLTEVNSKEIKKDTENEEDKQEVNFVFPTNNPNKEDEFERMEKLMTTSKDFDEELQKKLQGDWGEHLDHNKENEEPTFVFQNDKDAKEKQGENLNILPENELIDNAKKSDNIQTNDDVNVRNLSTLKVSTEAQNINVPGGENLGDKKEHIRENSQENLQKTKIINELEDSKEEKNTAPAETKQSPTKTGKPKTDILSSSDEVIETNKKQNENGSSNEKKVNILLKNKGDLDNTVLNKEKPKDSQKQMVPKENSQEKVKPPDSHLHTGKEKGQTSELSSKKVTEHTQKTVEKKKNTQLPLKIDVPKNNQQETWTEEELKKHAMKFEIHQTSTTESYSPKILSVTNAPVHEIKAEDDGTNVNKTLVFAEVIFRHGDRYKGHEADETYPHDPYAVEDPFWLPYGCNQLRNKGKMRAYWLGLFMRKHYNGFLKEQYYHNDIRLTSADLDRCIDSAHVMSVGLYPPKGINIWNDNVGRYYQPIPVRTLDPGDDIYLNEEVQCPPYEMELDKVLFEGMRSFNLKYRYVYEYLEIYSGMPVTTLEDVAQIYTTIRIENENGRKLPEWVNLVFPDKLKTLNSYYNQIRVSSDYFKKIRAGPLLTLLMDELKLKSINRLKPNFKIKFWSGFDTTILNLLYTIKETQPSLDKADDLFETDYSGALMIELHLVQKKYYIKVLYVNMDSNFMKSKAPRAIKICDGLSLCPLETFLERMDRYRVTQEQWFQTCNLTYCSNDQPDNSIQLQKV